MIIVSSNNENVVNTSRIIDKTPELNWYYIMGRPICGCGWSAIEDWKKGGGYIDHTPWMVFKMHVQEKHGKVVKVFDKNGE